MLPDIDSDTSTSFQECIYLTAGIGCVLTASRLRYCGIDSDLAILGGALVFLLIRFGIGTLIKRITSHRGMIHSIPMAILSGELAFFIVTGTVEERLVKAVALMIGYLSHLILDEVYSIDSTGAALRIKKSFGTALKWSDTKKPKAVMALYALIFCLGLAVCNSPDVIERINRSSQITETSPVSDPVNASWWSQLSGTAKSVTQSLQSEIKSEAAEFLSRQGLVGQPYSGNIVAKPAETELPSAMQIGNDWNHDCLPQPARIVIQ